MLTPTEFYQCETCGWATDTSKELRYRRDTDGNVQKLCPECGSSAIAEEYGGGSIKKAVGLKIAPPDADR